MSRLIQIYNGSNKGFTSFVKSKLNDQEYKDLTELAYLHDANNRIFTLRQENQQSEKQADITFPEIKNLVINADEYSGINESLLFNIEKYIDLFKIKNLIVHNPPQLLESNIERVNSAQIIKESEQYKTIGIDDIKDINTTLHKQIIGQNEAIEKILINLITLERQPNNNKPLVILLYGSSGVGKTESAKLIAESLNEKLFRKQLSMFQNNDFITYLFGGKHYEKSLARDLLERESNVILLDEFDKANQIAHSAFYQLFDEGVFEDKNYSVQLGSPIIFCTSNFTDIPTIRKELGDPIFSRFDSHIKFNQLDDIAIQTIISNAIDSELSNLGETDFNISKEDVLTDFEPYIKRLNNARLAKNLVKEYFSKKRLTKIIIQN